MKMQAACLVLLVGSCGLNQSPDRLSRVQHASVSEVEIHQRLPDDYRAGDVFTDSFSPGENGPQMVVIPPGTFLMGSPETEEGRYPDEGPQQQITIDYSFAVGRFEVTWEEYWNCVDADGCPVSYAMQRDDAASQGLMPMSGLSWHEAHSYTDWLSRSTGETYRLLSEAEWEYVARAGTTGRFSNDKGEAELCDIANGSDITRLSEFNTQGNPDCDDGFFGAAPVGSFAPNPFGLYDVHGNVTEWIQDCYVDNLRNIPTDGSARPVEQCAFDNIIPTKGGSFAIAAEWLRSASRLQRRGANQRNALTGFRVARDIDFASTDAAAISDG
ncbi:formylglycine-generating enzyme family protein [Ponticaulis sp.]|uniref:formylglycine-generating enzyme family protein n=1 Tax=Ponticaulis sp. TaxID=2020902 RepID=UPI000B757F38|nr:formylglycine-generating enzyme family protein [Ponticaulis sp.]MAI90659.1 chromophore maturation protein PvdO [Ponticaulis sp.]OUX99169.1 MAG: hypothetical protein CBB65_09485 [Hyphomonadaceae bacterium TMED5]|tara:strand:- start:45913 stop:46896 length:984 start_codon:yes stop_codon:yes gene_type:complete